MKTINYFISLVLIIMGLVFNQQILADNTASVKKSNPIINQYLNEYSSDYLKQTSQFTLPFHLIDGYIMIEGRVNNKQGRFMFDTGTPFSFFLNNHFLALAKHQYIGKGKAASGQPLVLYGQKNLKSLTIMDTIAFENLKSVVHSDFYFIEKDVVKNYLGFIGHGFNKNYLFVIDYDKQLIDFYALNQENKLLETVLNKDNIITTLQFDSKDDGRIPEVEFSIGNEKIIGKFDTGNLGSLKLTESMKEQLISQGYLIVENMEYLYGGKYQPYISCTLKQLRYDNQTLADIHHLKLEISDVNEIGMGYQFLKQYVTAWNYKNKTISLLKK